jgi:predicted KAP-like P-loop ATPase
LRCRLERILREEGKRIVVMIDDIDRLDRSETHAILKLVKLSASFSHTSYILALDDEMVAAALGERYGQGGVESGRSFLEKIVQVPLHLPPADQIELRKLTLTGVDAALETSGITLSEEQVQEFGHHFIAGLEPRIATPRHAKLFGNALTFALPLLKGEANPVDLILIEGVRIFYPKLYAGIRDNPEVFLRMPEGHGVEEHRQRQTQLIEGALSGIGVQSIRAIRRGLIEPLFPRTSNMGYGNDWDPIWAQQQRICSHEYFQRYFTYSVPPGDIGDGEVARFLDALSGEGLRDAHPDALIVEFAERRRSPSLSRNSVAGRKSWTPQSSGRWDFFLPEAVTSFLVSVPC